MIMNFIHKTLCFSGDHNVRGVFWGSRLPFHIRQAFPKYEVPEIGPIIVPSRIAAKGLVFRIRSRTRILSAQRSSCSPSVVLVRSIFLVIPDCHKMLEEGFFHIIMSAVSSFPVL